MLVSNMENLKLKMFGEGIFVKFNPDDEQKLACVEYGKEFGKALIGEHAKA